MNKGQLQFINGKLQARIEELEAEKGVPGMGFISTEAKVRIAELKAKLDKTETHLAFANQAIVDLDAVTENIDLALRGRIADLQAQLKELEWVKVEDELPDFEVEVLACCYCNEEYTLRQLDYSDGWRDECGDFVTTEITHWKPITLPKE